ncbi:MAG: DUF2911 domain-containing protein [Spirosomataceae bacterium]
MKKIIAFATAFCLSFVGMAQDKAPASPKMTVETSNAKLTYGQPSKKGREIFGKLVPYGQVWRTGANEATTIEFKKEVTFGGKKVKAGTYSLFTIPGESEWTFILNSELGQWGAYKYNEIKGKNVAEVKVKSTTNATEVEKMTFNLDDSNLSLMWDKVKVSVPLKY